MLGFWPINDRMKIFYALIFFSLGGVLYFLLKSPEKEIIEQETFFPEERPSERGISNQIFYPPVPSKRTKKEGKTNGGDSFRKGEKEIQLNLKEAVSNELFGGLISGSQAIGSMTIFENQIQSLSLSLTPFGKPPINIQLENIPLETGGSFVFEGDDEMISGILTPSGDKNYVLRFATGPLVGSTLLFEIISSLEDKVGLEEEQIGKAYSMSDQIETQEMNQQPDTSYSEMNNEPPPDFQEMPVGSFQSNQELPPSDSFAETSPYDMQESTDSSDVNF